MATGDGRLMTIKPSHQRDARQVAGLAVLGVIGALVTIALLSIILGATVTTDGQGEWRASLETVQRVTLFTLWQAFLSLVLSVLLAIPVALALDNLPAFFGRRLVLLVFTIPLALPVIVAVMALLELLGRNGLLAQGMNALGVNWRPDIYGLSGILIAHVFFNMPLAVRIILQRFDAIAQEQWKLAESLRFSAWHRFRLMQWPALLSVLPGVSSLIFLLCLGSYAIILVLGGGPQATTLQVAIYQALSLDFDISRAAILTFVQLGITMILLWTLPNMPVIPVQNMTGGTRRYHRLSLHSRIAGTSVIVFAAASIALPLAAIVLSGLAANHGKLLADPLLWQALATSFAIGVTSALLAVSAAWALSAASHSYGKNRSSFAGVLASVPLALLAVPSLVLGVGWFLFALKTGLPYSIAPLLIVLANAMMALPFAMQILSPKLHDNFNAHDRLASSLGMTTMARLRLIDLPVMRPALVTAALFAFALSLGDLGVVTLFGADQILTLPALIFQKMGSYRSHDAAGIALYLALLTALLTYLAMKAERHD
ncbi:MAG: ABC transporter permease subunit [Rhizobiaceae bacterium]